MSKKEIRKEILSQMKQLDKEHKLRADAWLKNQLINNTEYKNAKRIGIVLSMTHEVDTYPIIETMLSDGKKVFVPNTNRLIIC